MIKENKFKINITFNLLYFYLKYILIFYEYHYILNN